MGRVASKGIELEYDVVGAPEGAPLLLISPLSGQLTDWESGFLQGFVDRGLRVITFDNRDAGLSSKTSMSSPDLMAAFQAHFMGRPVPAPYLLADMAHDAAAVLDAVGVAHAHVVGVSMGGMIAQEMAIRMPQRLTTLTSIMSTPGDPALARHSPGAANFLATPVPTARAAYIEDAIRRELWLGGDAHPTDADLVRQRVSRSYDRCFEPDGVARQALAVLASPDRTLALGGVELPALVVHGDADPLVSVRAGEATAEAIPGARLVVVAGMGHALRPAVWPEVTDAVCAHLFDSAARQRSDRLSEAAA